MYQEHHRTRPPLPLHAPLDAPLGAEALEAEDQTRRSYFWTEFLGFTFSLVQVCVWSSAPRRWCGCARVFGHRCFHKSRSRSSQGQAMYMSGHVYSRPCVCQAIYITRPQRNDENYEHESLSPGAAVITLPYDLQQRSWGPFGALAGPSRSPRGALFGAPKKQAQTQTQNTNTKHKTQNTNTKHKRKGPKKTKHFFLGVF